MIIPIKCFTCGNVLADKYLYYQKRVIQLKLDKKQEDDTILDVFEKGYTYRDKVIRHAKVIVNKK